MKAQPLGTSAAFLLLAVCSFAAPLPAGRPKERCVLEGHLPEALAFSPDGKILASAGRDGTARLWDVASRKCTAILEGHEEGPGAQRPFVAGVAFSPDGKTVASAGFDGAVKLWNVATGKCIATLKNPGSVLHVAFSLDGKALAAYWGGVTVWDVQTEKPRAVYKDMVGQSAALAFDRKGKVLFAGSDIVQVPRNPAAFAVWDAETGKQAFLRTVRAHSVTCLAFSPDGELIAAGGRGSPVQVWEVATGKNSVPFDDPPGRFVCLTFSPDRKVLACGFIYTAGEADANPRRMAVCLYDTATGKALATLQGNPDPVGPLAFSPDGRILATGNPYEKKITLWDLPARLKDE